MLKELKHISNFHYLFLYFPSFIWWLEFRNVYLHSFIILHVFYCKSFTANTSLKRHICCEDNDEDNMPDTEGTCSWNWFHGIVSIRLEKKVLANNRLKMESLLRVRNIHNRSRTALAVHRPSFLLLPKECLIKCAGVASSEFPNSVAC